MPARRVYTDCASPRSSPSVSVPISRGHSALCSKLRSSGTPSSGALASSRSKAAWRCPGVLWWLSVVGNKARRCQAQSRAVWPFSMSAAKARSACGRPAKRCSSPGPAWCSACVRLAARASLQRRALSASACRAPRRTRACRRWMSTISSPVPRRDNAASSSPSSSACCAARARRWPSAPCTRWRALKRWMCRVSSIAASASQTMRLL